MFGKMMEESSPTPLKRKAIRTFLLILPFMLSPLGDRMLGLLGLPDEFAGWVTHPPHYSEVRRNIEFTEKFQTNGQGLRYKEIPLQKPLRTRRIFVVGDSNVEGRECKRRKCSAL